MAVCRQSYVLFWTQTEVDGLRGRPVASVQTGSVWRWSGEAVVIDGPVAIDGRDGLDGSLHALRHAFRAALPEGRLVEGIDVEEAELTRLLVLCDGHRRFSAGLVDLAELARPLLLFAGELPPGETDLRVADTLSAEGRAGAAPIPMAAPAVVPPPVAPMRAGRFAAVARRH